MILFHLYIKKINVINITKCYYYEIYFFGFTGCIASYLFKFVSQEIAICFSIL